MSEPPGIQEISTSKSDNIYTGDQYINTYTECPSSTDQYDNEWPNIMSNISRK